MSDDYTSRPAIKRVRSDQDHSKAETKEREDKIQGNDKDGKDDKDKGNSGDEDWLSQPPFSVGASWDGFETKWRSSCWCGKSRCSGDSSTWLAANISRVRVQ